MSYGTAGPTASQLREAAAERHRVREATARKAECPCYAGNQLACTIHGPSEATARKAEQDATLESPQLYDATPLLVRKFETPAIERHPNSARFHEILAELGKLHDRKQADYGRDDDPFANVRASEEWGARGWVGAMIRANDKVRRLQSLLRNGNLANESAEDSLRDIAVYAVIALVLFEQDNKEESQ